MNALRVIAPDLAREAAHALLDALCGNQRLHG
jgi:hypothetical protein